MWENCLQGVTDVSGGAADLFEFIKGLACPSHGAGSTVNGHRNTLLTAKRSKGVP